MHETIEILMQAFGEKEAWKYLRLLAAQLSRFSTGSTDTTQLVARGEVPMGVAQPQMNAMAARKDGFPVRDLLPEKTILVPEAVALLKGAPNEGVGKIFLDWLFSMDGQKYVLEGRYFAARTDIKFSEWEKEGVEMATHAQKALGVDSFWDLKVDFIEYDLDLATKRWDDVNKKYEYEIYRKWGELKSSLFLIEEVEGEIEEAKAANMQTAKAEAQIKEMSQMYRHIISEIVEQGLQEGTIRKDLYVGLVKRFIIGAVDEVINTWLHSNGEYDLVSMADPLVELFMTGIGQKPAATARI
jgi:spermidine/putrescine-binding protein